MKEIIINSPKYGIKIVMVDDCWYAYLNQWGWHLAKRKTNFYAYRHISKKTRNILGITYVAMHDIIMGTVYESINIDHENHNGLDNQEHNLRGCTRSQNICNKNKSKNKVLSSVYKGVHRAAGKWRARIHLLGKDTHLGYFNTEIEAALAYNSKAKELQGEFACLNVIEPLSSLPLQQS